MQLSMTLVQGKGVRVPPAHTTQKSIIVCDLESPRPTLPSPLKKLAEAWTVKSLSLWTPQQLQSSVISLTTLTCLQLEFQFYYNTRMSKERNRIWRHDLTKTTARNTWLAGLDRLVIAGPRRSYDNYLPVEVALSNSRSLDEIFCFLFLACSR